MPRPTKAEADDAIVRFYGALVDLDMDDDDVPGVGIMMPVADVRAIVRDRNVLQSQINEADT